MDCKHKKKDGVATFVVSAQDGSTCLRFVAQDGGPSATSSYEYPLPPAARLQKSAKSLAAILDSDGKKRIFTFASSAILDGFCEVCMKAIAGNASRNRDRLHAGVAEAGNKRVKQEPEARDAPAASGRGSREEQHESGDDDEEAGVPQLLDAVLEEFVAGTLPTDEADFLNRLLDGNSALFEKYVLEEQSHSPIGFLKLLLNGAMRDEEKSFKPSRLGAGSSSLLRGLGAAVGVNTGGMDEHEDDHLLEANKAATNASLAHYLRAFTTDAESGEMTLDAATRRAILNQNPNLEKVFHLHVNPDRTYSEKEFWADFVLRSNYFLALQGKPHNRPHNAKFDPYIPAALQFSAESDARGAASSSGAHGTKSLLMPTSSSATLGQLSASSTSSSSGVAARKTKELLTLLEDPESAAVVEKITSDPAASSSSASWRLTQWNTAERQNQGSAHTGRTRILHKLNQLSASALVAVPTWEQGGRGADSLTEKLREERPQGEENEMDGLLAHAGFSSGRVEKNDRRQHLRGAVELNLLQREVLKNVEKRKVDAAAD
eukprot:g13081.t1